MIKEVLVVEGKMDVVAIKKAVEADCLITEGFNLKRSQLKNIELAYQKRGIIIFTDPDVAGERIRRFLAKRFPAAKHAFIPLEAATSPKDGDIGVEQASSGAIRLALAKVRTECPAPTIIFTSEDMLRHSLSGAADATRRRAKVGAILGIGFANAKTFLKRLNHYGITRDEFMQAIDSLKEDRKI